MTPRSPAYLVAASGVRGALLPALGCGVLGVAVATLQGAGARNGALAAVVGVYGFLLSGIPVELLAISLDRLKGFTVLALGYLARVVAFGGYLWWATSAVVPLTGDWLAWGTLAVVVGWLTGIIWAQRSARVPVFDVAEPTGAADGG